MSKYELAFSQTSSVIAWDLEYITLEWDTDGVFGDHLDLHDLEGEYGVCIERTPLILNNHQISFQKNRYLLLGKI